MSSGTWREASKAKTSSFSRPKPNGGRPRGRALTADERAATERRRTLELALMRAKAEMATARTGTHREMLVQAIAALERQLVAGDA